MRGSTKRTRKRDANTAQDHVVSARAHLEAAFTFAAFAGDSSNAVIIAAAKRIIEDIWVQPFAVAPVPEA